MRLAPRLSLAGYFIAVVCGAVSCADPPPSYELPRDASGGGASVSASGGSGAVDAGSGGSSAGLVIDYPTSFDIGGGQTLDCSVVNEANFGECYIAMYCSAALDCCTSWSLPADFSTCFSLYKEWTTVDDADFFEGMALVDGQVAPCLQAMSELSCAQLEDPEPPACNDAIVPTQTTGQVCDSSWDCIDEPPLEAYCDNDVCVQGEAQRGGVGAHCNDITMCDWELTCGNSFSCQPRGAAGAACTIDWDCVEPLRCIDAQCAPARLEGETCSSNAECALELMCDVESFGNVADSYTSTCVPVGNVGAACTSFNQCREGGCSDGVCTSPYDYVCEYFAVP